MHSDQPDVLKCPRVSHARCIYRVYRLQVHAAAAVVVVAWSVRAAIAESAHIHYYNLPHNEKNSNLRIRTQCKIKIVQDIRYKSKCSVKFNVQNVIL